MKKSSPWWWSKMSQELATHQPVMTVTDYLLSASGDLEQLQEDDRLFCGPSEDIWKKFELLPTPPRSPSRPSLSDDEDFLVLEPKLNLVSDLLDSPNSINLSHWHVAPTGLKNDLLHDCMWSGQCTDTCKRGHPEGMSTDSGCCSTPVDTVPTASVIPHIKVEPVDVEEESPADVSPPTLYVDPCTMLPYTPLSDHSYHTQKSTHFGNPKTPPICDTPSDTEDDEIDVVTLPPQAIKTEPIEVVSQHSSSPRFVITGSTRKRLVPVTSSRSQETVPPFRVVVPPTVTVKRQYKDRRGASRKRFQKRRNSVSPSNSWVRKPYKRRFPLPQQQPDLNRSFSCSSDSEDCVEKRSMHNSMERKRRDDLRFAFQTLREHVPELASNPKAPKVLILNRAASYARQLNQTGQALEKMLKQETKRRQELQRKLMQLSKLK